MSEILFHYQKINPTTWVYLSSLLMIGLFFQFNRFWSVRNLDLVLLILLAPGLLMINQARSAEEVALAASRSAATTPAEPAVATPAADETASDADPEAATAAAKAAVDSRRHMLYVGYLWLFAVSLIWLVRLLADP